MVKFWEYIVGKVNAIYDLVVTDAVLKRAVLVSKFLVASTVFDDVVGFIFHDQDPNNITLEVLEQLLPPDLAHKIATLKAFNADGVSIEDVAEGLKSGHHSDFRHDKDDLDYDQEYSRLDDEYDDKLM
ncbi:hypothetical protein FOA52_009112 [Chlamydomonas sp. UWO 241]|nr:hypothetical protein FOA52_009112 [Chlamydomonas sp. UWO 241]